MPQLDDAISRRGALGIALATLGPSTSTASAEPDPIFAAIQVAQDTDCAFTAAIVDIDENDVEAMHAADDLADLSSDAMKALAATVPTSTAGLYALIRHYAEDTFAQDRWSVGAVALAHLARVIGTPPPG